MDTKGLFKKAVNLVTLASFLLWNMAVATPEGGSVAQGSAGISQSGNVTTVNQTSQNAVINWQSFNTASNEAVKFNQPNSSAVALNRINNGLPTQFAGQLSANGNVWILNPAGVLFTSTAKVDVAGLLATTHSISDADFMAGNYKFNLVPGSESANIINNGLISAKDSGIIALVAPHVQNNGLIQVNLGKVSLASGSAYTLDLYGDSLINFGSNAPINNGSVSNAGQIIADGGKVYMTANSAAGVLDNVINMSGTIQAKSVGVNPKGQIVLNGGKSGTVKVTGKLNASTGGTVETSGANVEVSLADIEIGAGGTWIFDPPDVNIDFSLATTIMSQLNANTNVSVTTLTSGGGTGDININSPITWTTSAQLFLGAFNNINVNQPLTATSGGGVIMRADYSPTPSGTGTVNFSGSGLVNNIGGSGSYVGIYYNPTGGYNNPSNFIGYFIGNAPVVGYMMINNIAQFQQATAAGSNNILYSYSLNNDIDVSGLYTSGAMFDSNLMGNFDGHDYATGLNHKIYNINTTLFSSGQGAFAFDNYAVIQNIGFEGTVNGSPTFNTGGILGVNRGVMNNVYFSGAVSGESIGAFASANVGLIMNSYTTPTTTITATSTFNYNGGIVGSDFGGTYINVYNAASEGPSSAFNSLMGGIFGISFSSAVKLINVYNVGNVDRFNVGHKAIAALNFGYTQATGLYWDTTTCPTCSGGAPGLNPDPSTGLNDAQMKVASNFAGYDFVNTWTTNGNTTYPQLIVGPQNVTWKQLSGTIQGASGSQGVSIYQNGSAVGGVGSLANGGYTVTFFNSTPASGAFLVKTSGVITGDTIDYVAGSAGNINIVNNQVTVQSDSGYSISNADLAINAANATSYNASGNNISLLSNRNFVSTTGTPFNLSGNITTSGIGGITFAGVTKVMDGTTITLTSPSLVNFKSMLVGDTNSTGNLTVSAGGGSVFFQDAVGTIGSLFVSSSFINIFTNSINTVNNQTYNGAVQLREDTTLSSTSGNITLGGTVDSCPNFVATCTGIQRSLTVNATSIGGLAPPTGPGVVTFNGIVGGINLLNSLTVTATWGTVINTTAISTVGNQSYNPVTLTGTPSVYLETSALNLTGANILFNGSLVFNHNLVTPNQLTITGNLSSALNSGLKSTTGGFGSIDSLHVTGTTSVVGGVTTQHNQLYDGGVTTLADAFFDSLSGNITFGSTIVGTGSNLVNATALNGTVEVNGQIGIVGNGSPLSINALVLHGAAVNIKTPSIYTNTEQNYLGPVQLFQDTSMTVYFGLINFLGAPTTLNSNGGAKDLIITAPSGQVQFDGTVGNSAPLKNLDITAFNVNINTPQISTSVNQNYNAALVWLFTDVNAPGLVAGGNINFAGQLAALNPGAQSLVANAVGTVTFGGVVGGSPFGSPLPLNNLTVTGTTNINTFAITTANNQLFNGPVILGANSNLTSSSGNITFGSTVDGGANLTVSAAGAVEFDGIVGATPLHILDVTGGAGIILNTTGITTTDNQIYRSPILLNADPVVINSGKDIVFFNTIDSLFAGAGGLDVTASATLFIFDMIGSNTPLSSLTVSAPGSIVSSLFNPSLFEIITTGDQKYSGNFELNVYSPTNSTVHFQGNNIEIVNQLSGAQLQNIIFTGNLIVDAGANIGQSNVVFKDITVTGTSTIGGNVFNKNNQVFEGPVFLSHHASFSSQILGDIVFQKTVDGPGGMSVTVANGAVRFNDYVGSSTSLGNLFTAANALYFSNPTHSTSVTTVDYQNYNGSMGTPILLDTLNDITFSASKIDLFNTIDSFGLVTPLPTAVTIIGQLNAYPTVGGNIGQNFAAANHTSLLSFDVKGPAYMGVNVRTLSDQRYEQLAKIGSDVNFTSVTGNIIFNSTLDTDTNWGGSRALVLNAGNNVEFQGNVGVDAYLYSVDVTAGNQILINSHAENNFVITTIAGQTYNGTVALTPNSTLATPYTTLMTSTAGGGDITFNGIITINQDSSPSPLGRMGFFINADHDVIFNNIIALNTAPFYLGQHGGYLDVTAGHEIIIDTPTIETGIWAVCDGCQGQSFSFRSPVILMQDLVITAPTSGLSGFYSTVDGNTFGGQSLTVDVPDVLDFAGNIGSNTPLSSFAVMNSFSPFGGYFTSLRFRSGLASITTTGNQDYHPPIFYFDNGGMTYTSLNNGTVHFYAENTAYYPGERVAIQAGFSRSVIINGNAEFDGDIIPLIAANQPNVSFLTGPVSVSGSTIFRNGASIDSTSQNYQGPVTMDGGINGQIILNSTGTIHFASTVDSIATPTTLIINNADFSPFSAGAVQFDGAVGSNVNLNNLDLTGAVINLSSPSIQTVGNQSYHGPVVLQADVDASGMIAGGNIIFDSTIDGVFNLTANATGIVQFNGPVGASPLNILDVTASQINIDTTSISASYQNYHGPVVLGVSSTLTGANLIFDTTVDGAVDLTLDANADFYGNVGVGTNLQSLTVTGYAAFNGPNINTVHTTSIQDYHGQVTLISDMNLIGTQVTFGDYSDGSNGLYALTVTGNFIASGDLGFFVKISSPFRSVTVTGTTLFNNNASYVLTDDFQDYQEGVTLASNMTLNAGGIVTFESTVDSALSSQDLSISASEVHFKGNVGSNPLGVLNVAANIINFDGGVTSITSTGTQTYIGATLMSMNADPLFTAPNFVIAIPVLINANTTYTSTAGDIDFQQAITGDGIASLILNPVGGSAIFRNTVGTNIAPLGSLTVNGTSIFNQGSAQNVYTNGDQIYVGTSEINNDVALEALTTGLIALGIDSAGFFDNPSNSHHLNVLTHNAAYGTTGQGITGHVNVGSFTVGGEGGANVSPLSQTSIVATGTGDQAFVNWLLSPEITNTYYCINGAAGCGGSPTPPTPIFYNIPPIEIFNIPPSTTCSGSGCAHLEVMIDNLVEAGVVECGGVSGCAFGFATAEDTNGNVRILVPGSMVYVGDKIMKDKDACVCVKSLYKKEKSCMGPKDQRAEVKT